MSRTFRDSPSTLLFTFDDFSRSLRRRRRVSEGRSSLVCVRVHFCHRFNHRDKVPCKPSLTNNKSRVTNTDPFHIDRRISMLLFRRWDPSLKIASGVGRFHVRVAIVAGAFALVSAASSGTFFAWWNIDLCFSPLRPHARLFTCCWWMFSFLILLPVPHFFRCSCSEPRREINRRKMAKRWKKFQALMDLQSFYLCSRRSMLVFPLGDSRIFRP